MEDRPVTTALDAQYVSVAEAADLLDVDPSTIRRWIEHGTLPAYRVGRRYVRIRKDDLSRVIAPMPAAKNAATNSTGGGDSVGLVMSDEDQRLMFEAIGRARTLRREVLAKRGGIPFSPSWELVDEVRDERTEQLP